MFLFEKTESGISPEVMLNVGRDLERKEAGRTILASTQLEARGQQQTGKSERHFRFLRSI
jgi:hypothetical protein